MKKIKTDTRANLERVAEHLYRHQVNGTYYGIIKAGGRKHIKALRVSEDLPPTTDRATANRLLRTLENEIARRDVVTGDMTLTGLIAKFKNTRSGKAPKTIATEASMLARFEAEFGRNAEGCRAFGMEQMVSRVKPSDVSTWLAGLAKCGLRNSSYNLYRRFTANLFQLAVNDGVIEKSPFVERDNRAKKRQKVVRNIPTKEEFEKIIAEVRMPAKLRNRVPFGGGHFLGNPDSANFLEFLGRAGLGQAEASNLKWGDVDFEKGYMEIIRQKTGRAYGVPIYAELEPLLRRMHKAAGNPKPDAPVFAVKDVDIGLSRACARLGLLLFSPRNLRAMKIRELYDAGVDVKTIARWQGHSDGGKLIMDTYTEIFRSTDNDYEAMQLTKANGKLLHFAKAA